MRTKEDEIGKNPRNEKYNKKNEDESRRDVTEDRLRSNLRRRQGKLPKRARKGRSGSGR